MKKVDPTKIGHFRGGLLSVIFSKKHFKCLKSTLGISRFRTSKPKNAVLRDLECFFEKMAESRPPLKWPILGGLLSDIFSKKHSKSLKLTLENGQKSGIYKVKFQKLQREDLPSIFGQISPLRPFHEYPPVQQVYHIYFCKKNGQKWNFFVPPFNTQCFILKYLK